MTRVIKELRILPLHAAKATTIGLKNRQDYQHTAPDKCEAAGQFRSNRLVARQLAKCEARAVPEFRYDKWRSSWQRKRRGTLSTSTLQKPTQKLNTSREAAKGNYVQNYEHRQKRITVVSCCSGLTVCAPPRLSDTWIPVAETESAGEDFVALVAHHIERQNQRQQRQIHTADPESEYQWRK